MRYQEIIEAKKKKLELPDIEIGDEVKVGRFKNRKAEVTGFKKDDHNQPVLKTTKGDQKLFKPRIVKLMKESKFKVRVPDNEIFYVIGTDKENRKYFSGSWNRWVLSSNLQDANLYSSFQEANILRRRDKPSHVESEELKIFKVYKTIVHLEGE